ncbi:unnamed protein product, partial [Timema podura]|nr:unnamed protein product [Timema podura]
MPHPGNKPQIRKSVGKHSMYRDQHTKICHSVVMILQVLLTFMAATVLGAVETRGRVGNDFGNFTLSIPDRDSNLVLPIIGSLVYCESSALDHTASEGGPSILKQPCQIDQNCKVHVNNSMCDQSRKLCECAPGFIESSNMQECLQ